VQARGRARGRRDRGRHPAPPEAVATKGPSTWRIGRQASRRSARQR
jgi:hypothetical protein